MSAQHYFMSAVWIINPSTKEGHFLRDALGRIIVFQDRDDAIAYAKLYIRKKSFVERFEVRQISNSVFRRGTPITLRCRRLRLGGI